MFCCCSQKYPCREKCIRYTCRNVLVMNMREDKWGIRGLQANFVLCTSNTVWGMAFAPKHLPRTLYTFDWGRVTYTHKKSKFNKEIDLHVDP